jgi:hypothetical protein
MPESLVAPGESVELRTQDGAVMDPRSSLGAAYFFLPTQVRHHHRKRGGENRPPAGPPPESGGDRPERASVVAPVSGGRASLQHLVAAESFHWRPCSAASSMAASGIRPTTSQPEIAAPWRAASARTSASTRWIGVASVFTRFMLTWARPFSIG